MQIEKLIRDASEAGPAASVRDACRRLAIRLNKNQSGAIITPGGINKWIERGSVPGPWLMRIAKDCEIDITAYA